VKGTLPGTMRDLLIEHLDGRRVPFVTATPRVTISRALLARGWVVPDRENRPRFTTITQKGREVLAAALADWADAIARSNEMREPGGRLFRRRPDDVDRPPEPAGAAP